MRPLEIFALLFLGATSSILAQQDEAAQAYLDTYSSQLEALYYRSSLASWAYYTNLTSENQKVMTDRSLEVSLFSQSQVPEAAKFNQTQITNDTIKRQLDMILDVGTAGYNDTSVLRRISELEAGMTDIYSSAKWENKPLEPDLTDIMTNVRDHNQLRDAWKGWRDVSGRQMKKQYEEFVNLLNTAIRDGGKYEDIGHYYRSWYEDDNFEKDVESLYQEFKPLYEELHAYVRRKLKAYYKDATFPESGHIPAHLFGNMWAQQWNNIYAILVPYQGMERPSLTEEMRRQNYNVTYMYQVAEEFFTSIGLERIPASFWTNSMLVKPDDRDVVCHASAWDFNNGTDFRIKQCTEVTEDQLLTVHHEMGHVQYYIEYKPQPVLFRGGANPGFHEGVADIVSLSFQTPEHLKKIGLLDEVSNSTEADINFLFQMALDKVAFLPFGYLIDQWRWSVFRGDVTPENYNKEWWKLRCNYQGIFPPVERSENDFDPGAKFHVPGNTPYIRYFVSFVTQFQWHKALCQIAGHTGPLHRCDIYENAEAGQRLREMLQMGASKPWGEAMRMITRGTPGETDKMSAAPLLEYFQTLLDWLKEQNRMAGDTVSWQEGCPAGSFSSSFTSDGRALTSIYTTTVAIVVSAIALLSLMW